MKRRLLLLSPLAWLARLRGEDTVQPWDPADFTLYHWGADPTRDMLTICYDSGMDRSRHYATFDFEDGTCRRLWLDGREQEWTPYEDLWVARTLATVRQQFNQMTTRRPQ